MRCLRLRWHKRVQEENLEKLSSRISSGVWLQLPYLSLTLSLSLSVSLFIFVSLSVVLRVCLLCLHFKIFTPTLCLYFLPLFTAFFPVCRCGKLNFIRCLSHKTQRLPKPNTPNSRKSFTNTIYRVAKFCPFFYVYKKRFHSITIFIHILFAGHKCENNLPLQFLLFPTSDIRTFGHAYTHTHIRIYIC